MTKKLKSIIVQQTLVEKRLFLFSKLEFQRLFGVSKTATTFFLFHHTRDGLFVRLKNGLYALSSHFPSEEEIANRLYQPSYLSFEYILSRHGIIPEAVYAIISATTKPSRTFAVEGKNYVYSTIKKEVFTGYLAKKVNDRLILTASAEKALVDTLYFVHLKKKSLPERLDLSSLSKRAIFRYARLFGRPNLVKFIRGIYDRN